MYQDMYAKMLVEMRTYAIALSNAIKAIVGLQALTPAKGRPSNAVRNLRIQKAAHEEEMFSIVDPGFKPSTKAKKYKFSAATRKKLSLAQKKRWAQVKKGKKKLPMKFSRKKVA